MRILRLKKGAFCLGLALLAGCAANTSTQRWSDSYHAGVAALDKGDTGTARLHLEKSLLSAETRPDDFWPLRAASLEQLARACVREQRPGKAVRYLREAAALRERPPAKSSDQISTAFQLASLLDALHTGQSLVWTGYVDEGEAFHIRYLKLAEQMEPSARQLQSALPGKSLRVVESANLALALLRVGEPKRALPHLDYALATQPLTSLSRTHGWVPIVLEYADALEAVGRFDDAQAQRSLVRDLSSGPDYFDNVRAAYDEHGFRAWDPSVLPFKLFVGQPPAGWRGSGELAEIALSAAADWSDAVRRGVPSFEFVAAPQSAHIQIAWNPRIPERSSLAGHTASQVDHTDERIVSVVIEIAVGRAGAPVSPEQLRHVVRHEIGHAIGLQGHSPSPGDLMYPYLDRAASAISARDIATLRHLFPCRWEPGRGVSVYRRKEAALRCE